MKKLLLISFLFSLVLMGTSCGNTNYGDPTRPSDARKVKQENNKILRSQFGNR